MKNFMLRSTPLDSDLAALLLRLVLGGLFLFHGIDKIIHYHQYLPMFRDVLGIGSRLSFILVIVAEFAGGMLVTAGFLTRLAVIPIFISMSIAYWVALAKSPFLVKELPFTFWLLTMVVFLLGSGKFSMDAMLLKKKPSVARRMV